MNAQVGALAGDRFQSRPRPIRPGTHPACATDCYLSSSARRANLRPPCPRHNRRAGGHNGSNGTRMQSVPYLAPDRPEQSAPEACSLCYPCAGAGGQVGIEPGLQLRVTIADRAAQLQKSWPTAAHPPRLQTAYGYIEKISRLRLCKQVLRLGVYYRVHCHAFRCFEHGERIEQLL